MRKWRSPIPRAALDMHMAVLATSGAGKTFTIKACVEDLLDEGVRVVAIDPIGNWFGLRTLKNGKPGFPVVIFGGEHADVPIDKHSGEGVARIIARDNLPAVIDISMMNTFAKATFFADFAEALMRENNQPLHVVIDEAHLFMPQSPPRGRGEDDIMRCLLAGNALVSGGRARGISCALISQRASKVHKDSVTQCKTLIAMQNIHKLDRKVVDDYVEGFASKEDAATIATSLARLPTGEGWVYSPTLDVLERVSFPLIRTLDTSRRPEAGEVRPPPASLKNIDLTALVEALKPAEAEPERSPHGEDKKPPKKRVRSYSQREFDEHGKARFLAGRRAERAALRRVIHTAIEAAPLTAEATRLKPGQKALAAAVGKLAPCRPAKLAAAVNRISTDGRWYRDIAALEAAGLIIRDDDGVVHATGSAQ